MKKILVCAIIIVIAAGGGYFAYRYAHPELQQAPAVSSSAVSSASSAVSSSSVSVPMLRASAASTSQASTKDAKHSAAGKIQTSVKLDWNKYTLKPAASKVIKNKTYETYDISDEEALVGPKILVDPSSGKVYTWTSTDTAPVPAATDKAFDKTVRTVTGTVESGAMMNVVLKTADGNELVVRRLGVDTSGLTSLKVGDKIKVTYTGVINGNDTTRAFITKLENVK